MRELRAKALSLVLAICMVFTLLPVSVSAEEAGTGEAAKAVVNSVGLAASKSNMKVDDEEPVTLTATVSGNNLTVSGNRLGVSTVSGNKIQTKYMTWTEPKGILTLGEAKLSESKKESYTVYTITKEATAAKAGKAVVTVTIGGETANCEVTVEDKAPAVVAVTGVTVNPTTATLEVGATQKLTANVAPENATNSKVTWSSSNTAVATVDADGNVKAVKAGPADITVTTEDGNMTATCKVTVKDKAPATVGVTGVTVSPTTATLEVGATKKLTATVAPSTATNQKVTWSSKNTAVATVDANGNVKAVKAGTADITVTTEDGNMTATCKVTVKDKAPATVAVTGVSVAPNKLALAAGKTGKLKATVAPSTATNQKVTWKSSDVKVAKVDASGKVTAVKAGTAKITVTTEDGKKTAVCTVTVTAKIGTSKTVGDAKYKVSGAGEVTYTAPKNTKATKVTIPDTVTINGQKYKVTEVATGAFKNNKKLKTVKIGKNVEKIGKNAFSGCTSVTTVTMGKNVKTIGESAFSGCTKLKKVNTGSTCTSIGKNAFKGCTSMTSVTVGKNVKTIGDSAFSGCKKLKKVNTGSACTSVGKNAFKDCKAMTSVTIGKNVTSIKDNAFNGCSKLKTITISTTKLKTVGKNAFKGISKSAKIKVPSSKLADYKKKLKGKGQASSVKITK